MCHIFIWFYFSHDANGTMPILLTTMNNKWKTAFKTFDKAPKHCMHSENIIVIIILYATNEMTSVMEEF